MKRGDIVRLKQSFRPDPNHLEEYRHGIVVGFAEIDDDRNQLGQFSQLSEVVLQLYDLETSKIYTDEFDTQPMFYFRISELEL